MKLLQALFLLSLILLFTLPDFSPKISASASSLNLTPSNSSLSASQDFNSKLPLSADSLQAQLEKAVWQNDTQVIKSLVEQGAQVNNINREDGYSALHWAVERRLTQMVRLLLDLDADVNMFTENAMGNDRTPLHIAAELGHTDIVQILLNHGADPKAKTLYGESPLHGVRLFVKSPEVVTLLIAHGADVNATTQFGATPLHSASLLGSASIATLLIEHGAKVNLSDKRGLSPLHHAAQNGHIAVVRRLLDAKSDINAQTRTGDTPTHLAAKKGHTEIIRLLLEEGANPLLLNKYSKSPLTEAKEQSHDLAADVLNKAQYTDKVEG